MQLQKKKDTDSISVRSGFVNQFVQHLMSTQLFSLTGSCKSQIRYKSAGIDHNISFVWFLIQQRDEGKKVIRDKIKKKLMEVANKNILLKILTTVFIALETTDALKEYLKIFQSQNENKTQAPKISSSV